MNEKQPMSSGQTAPVGAPRTDVPGARDNPFGPTAKLPEGYQSVPSVPGRRPAVITTVPEPTLVKP